MSRREGDERSIHHADVVRRPELRRPGPVRGLDHDVADHLPDHPPDRLQPHQPGLQPTKILLNRAQDRADKRHLGQLVQSEDTRRQPVIDVVVVVGDIVGDRRDLRFGRGPGPQAKIERAVEIDDRLPRRPLQHAGCRAVVLDDPFQGLPGQVQAVESGVAPFETGQHSEGLDVVVEPAPALHPRLQHILSRMAERRVAEIMAKADGLGEIGVETQRPGQRPRDLRHLKRMGQPGAEMVALVGYEDLGLLLQPPEGRGMDDAVAVAREGCAGGAGLLGIQPAARGGPVHGVRCAVGRQVAGVLSGRPSFANGRARSHIKRPRGSNELDRP